MNRTRLKGIVFFIILTLLLLHCAYDNGDPLPAEKEIARILIRSGNGQSGTGGSRLQAPVIVQLLDGGNQPLTGFSLHIAVVEGGGSITGESSRQPDGNGRMTIQWIIGSGYNGLEISMAQNPQYKALPVYVWAEGESGSGIHITRTLASFKKVEGVLYTMTFFGDYSHADLTRLFPQAGSNKSSQSEPGPIFCSLFSVFGTPGNYLMGRSFDNPSGWKCLTVITRIFPNDGYASIAPVRLRDVGLHPGIDLYSLSFQQLSSLIQTSYFPPDGINEHGLVMGLANVTPMPYDRDPAKKTINCTLWVRKVLDLCKTVDEAAELTRLYNISGNQGELNIHAIMADASGRSIILDPAEGEIKVIPHSGLFQVMTNSPIYQVPLDQRLQQCPRYHTIYERLAQRHGILNRQESLDLLQQVGNQWTEWSAVYLIDARGMSLTIDFNFNKVYDFSLSPGGDDHQDRP